MGVAGVELETSRLFTPDVVGAEDSRRRLPPSDYNCRGLFSRQEAVTLVGNTLGHYEILELIGVGGMGEVYRARDSKLGRDVAIKLISADALGVGTEVQARFEREARLLAALNHPGIASIHAIEEADGKPFLVLELVSGSSLAERLPDTRRSAGRALPTR